MQIIKGKCQLQRRKQEKCISGESEKEKEENIPTIHSTGANDVCYY